MLWSNPAFAQESDTQPIDISQQPSGNAALVVNESPALPPEQNIVSTIFPLILIFFIFYFLILRPQQKRLKAHRDLISNLKRGDRVVTTGGLIGTISKFDNDEKIIDLDVGNGTLVQVYRNSITDVLDKTPPAQGNKKKK